MNCRLAMLYKHLLILTLFVSASLSYGTPAFAREGQPGETQVKAAFVYNFGKFVEWPPDRSNVKYFTIGIYGDDDFVQALTEIVAGKFIHERPVFIRRVSTMKDIATCHILFVGDSAKDRLPELFNAVHRLPILTVSDLQGFADRGGMINFRIVKNHMRFAINLKAAQQAGLRISSQLLKLAIAVE